MRLLTIISHDNIVELNHGCFVPDCAELVCKDFHPTNSRHNRPPACPCVYLCNVQKNQVCTHAGLGMFAVKSSCCGQLEGKNCGR